MSDSAAVLAVLKSIDATLKEMLAVAKARKAAPPAAPAQQSSGSVASDADLDSQYGDPQVTFNPRDWPGTSCKGLQMSQCPAEFLDMIAETFEYFARKAEENNETTSSGKPVAGFKRKDAARARGWAKRVREGKVAAPAAAGDDWGGVGGDFR